MSDNTESPDRRYGKIERKTNESDVYVEIDLDGWTDKSNSYGGALPVSSCYTGIPFFDHMLSQLGKHSGMSLVVKTEGDLEVDTHHSVEDTGITLGQAFARALGDKAGVSRFAFAAVPLDEALAEVVVDLSGRGYLVYNVEIDNPLPLGSPGFEPQLAEEFLRAFALNGQFTLHVNLMYGTNTHHILEAVFKALGRAIGAAIKRDGYGIPSTKGVL